MQNVTHHVIRLKLAISRQQYLRYYQGVVSQVSAIALDGRRIHFPASALRSVIRPQGIYGVFELHFDNNNRLTALVAC